MLTIILGIVLAIILAFIFLLLGADLDVASVIFVILVLGAIGMGVFLPISGYEEWELKQETELISLSNDVASGGNRRVYVSLSADNVYTYRYEINSEFGTETSREYKTETLTGNGVEEIEDPNCEVPVIRVYQRTGKMSFWTFAVASAEYKYVFYVPEGSISKEVKLN